MNDCAVPKGFTQSNAAWMHDDDYTGHLLVEVTSLLLVFLTQPPHNKHVLCVTVATVNHANVPIAQSGMLSLIRNLTTGYP